MKFLAGFFIKYFVLQVKVKIPIEVVRISYAL